MLDRQDIQQIGTLLDDKLEENNKKLVGKDELRSILEENNEKLVTQESLKSILEDNNEKLVDRIAIEVGSVIEQNVTPTLDGMNERLERMDGRLTGVEDRLTRVETQMVTKSFLTNQLGDLKEEVVGKMRIQDTKVNSIIDSLEENAVLDKPAIKSLRAIEVFPAPPAPLVS